MKLNRILYNLGKVILLGFIILINPIKSKAQVYENPNACAAGTQPWIPNGVSRNPQTSNNRINACIDSSGNVTWVNSSDGSATAIYLSPNCSGSSAPCIQIPSSGGCYGVASGGSTVSVTGGSPIVTFSGGFPNPLPQIGQIAWVMTEHGGGTAFPSNLCETQFNSTLIATSWVETLYCGKAFSNGGTPVLITNVNQGAGTVTLSQNCQATGNTNAIFFYGPNIFSQMFLACQLGPVHLAQGFYTVDNSSLGTTGTSACGCGSGNCVTNGLSYFASGLSGEGAYNTVLFTPPWYQHESDLGTVIFGGTLQNISLDGSWIPVQNSVGRGTPYDGNACGSQNFNIIGFNFGNNATSETIYPDQTSNTNGPCIIKNAYIETGNSGIATGNVELIDVNITARVIPVFQNASGAVNGKIRLIGGNFASGGQNITNRVGSVIGHDTSQSPTGDIYFIHGADLCEMGDNPAINDNEASGEIRIVDSRINFVCPGGVGIGTNAGGITTASTINLKMVQTSIKAAGTGNTLNIPSGSTYFDNCGNFATGGAGANIAGTYIPAGGCALNDAAPTISSGFGTTPSISSGASVSSFQINVGTGGAATSGVIGLPTSPKTGWNCQVQDSTTNIATRQSANTVSTVTLTAASAWTASDILIVSCKPY